MQHSLKDVVGRLTRFFDSRIWIVRLADLRPGKAFLYRVSRIAYSTAHGFREDRLTFRAAALTYFSVLSIVPFLAFAFSVLKGFGAYRSFIEGTIRPYLRSTFSGNPALYSGIEKIVEFVDQTDVSSLGAFGMLLFVYTSISLLSNVEATLNDIWGAKTKRPFVRQVTDYTTLLVTTPLLLLVAVTFATAAQSSGVVLFLRHTMGLGMVIDFFLRLTSLLVACVAMVALFCILPNVRVRFTSALLGGVVAGVLWQVALVLHVSFQRGVASYNALYSGFAAIPIFLVWTYVSWATVLLGAQLAAAHQNEQAVRQMVRARRVDEAFKETLAIAVTALVTRDFLDGSPRRTHEELAEQLEVPPPTLNEIVTALVGSSVLARDVSGTAIGYVPGRDIDALRLEDVRDALRREGCTADLMLAIERQLGPSLQGLFQALEREGRDSPNNLTLRQLAELVSQGAVAAKPALEADAPVPVLDAKQPEVPA